MVSFGDKSKKKKQASWQQLSFAKTATKAEILAREQSTSHRVARVFTGTLAVACATFLVGFGSTDVVEDPWRGWLAAAGVVGGGIALHAAVSALKSAQSKTQDRVSGNEEA